MKVAPFWKQLHLANKRISVAMVRWAAKRVGLMLVENMAFLAAVHVLRSDHPKPTQNSFLSLSSTGEGSTKPPT